VGRFFETQCSEKAKSKQMVSCVVSPQKIMNFGIWCQILGMHYIRLSILLVSIITISF